MEEQNSQQKPQVQGPSIPGASTATRFGLQKGIEKGVAATAARMAAMKGAAAAAGTALGGPLGTVVATGVTTGIIGLKNQAHKIVLGIGTGIGSTVSALAAGVGAVIGAAVSGVVITIGIAAITIPVLIALIMFIINSGAYVVPFRAGGIGDIDFIPINVGASCPIPNGQILWGSYGNPYTDIGHGTNDYWRAVGRHCSSYPIAGGYARRTGDQCYATEPTSPTYGNAADFIYPNEQRAGQPVFFPYVNGESVTWTASKLGSQTGNARTNQGGTAYEMYLSHLLIQQGSHQSGDVMGTLIAQSTPHLHVELRIDGVYVPPEFMCLGSGVGDGDEPDPPQSQPTCSNAGGQCTVATDCESVGRTDIEGTCERSGSGNTQICCTVPQI